MHLIGQGEGSHIQGGVKINTFCSPDVRISNSSIQFIKYNDFFYAMFGAQQMIASAIYVNILETASSNKINHQTICNPNARFVMENSTLSNNFRALAFVGNPVIPYNVSILGSSFCNNHVLMDGGAVYLDSQDESNISISIDDCVFEENKAGYQELDYTCILSMEFA